MAYEKIEAATSVFAGQGDLGMFPEVSDYNTATFASLGKPKSFGQVVQDSSEWTGEAGETTSILDEQGNTITATVAAGTLGFSFDLASTSRKYVEDFLAGVDLPSLENENIGTGIKGAGFGVDLPVMTRPVYWLSDDRKRMWLYPKTKMTGNLSYADGLWRIHIEATCEYLDLSDLKTAMILDLTSIADAA